MNLVVDIGNTRTKVAVFDEETLVYHQVYDLTLKSDDIAEIANHYPIGRAIVSQVGAALDYDKLFGCIP